MIISFFDKVLLIKKKIYKIKDTEEFTLRFFVFFFFIYFQKQERKYVLLTVISYLVVFRDYFVSLDICDL